MASQLAMCFKDHAVAVLADLSPFQQRHYDSLVAALRERFEPDNQSQMHRAQLKSQRRQDNEPLPQLAHDIRRLVREKRISKHYLMVSKNCSLIIWVFLNILMM